MPVSVVRVTSGGLAPEPLLVTEPPVLVPDGLRPTQEEVAALLYDRVVKEGGQPADGFTNNTKPTVTEVERIITMAVNDLASRPDVPIPTENIDRGRWLATTYAAWLVVLIHAPEQTENSEGYEGLKDLFDSQVGAWVEQCQLPITPYMG